MVLAKKKLEYSMFIVLNNILAKSIISMYVFTQPLPYKQDAIQSQLVKWCLKSLSSIFLLLDWLPYQS